MNVIFDLDGTLSDTRHRRHFLQRDPKDWKLFNRASIGDPPIEAVVVLARLLHFAGHRIEIWTGRDQAYRAATLEWLRVHRIRFDQLRMRPTGDHREDTVLKASWLDEIDWRPDLVFEDRTRMVQWWRSRGIRCLQVAEGDF